eukprot:5702589-Lingulodinium_polyedra.AAC.1
MGEFDEVMAALAVAAQRALWRLAAGAGEVMAEGLIHGVDNMDDVKKEVARFQRQGAHRQRAATLAMVTAGHWTMARLHEAGRVQEALCQRCHREDEDLEH